MHDPVLQIRGVTKSFFGNNALTDIDFDLAPAEIHCICGENGAGKSTLIKLLSGAFSPTSGKIIIDGKTYASLTPKTAHDLGIQVIYQENNLLPNLEIAENLFMGQEHMTKLHLIDRKSMRAKAQEIISSLDPDMDASMLVCDLSVAQQQYVKIARALVYSPRILIFDEPTTMFNVTDAQKLLDLIVSLKNKGIGIIYISHKLSEIIQIADRVTVLRDGHRISCRSRTDREFTIEQITTDMIGRSVDLMYHRERTAQRETVLKVEDLQLKPQGPTVSFELHRGEVLGVAGMVGAGRTEIAEALFGYRKICGGKVWVDGREVHISTPAQAFQNGLCLITEDRQKLGLLLDMNINENITITSLDKLKGWLIDRRAERTDAESIIKKVNLKALDYETDAKFLSGGNQQKVVIGKWIYRDSSIVIFDEPTRGIDVNSKAEIYELMGALLKEGKAILMISSDMPELISMSDRVIIIREGAINGEFVGSDINEENIITKAL